MNSAAFPASANAQAFCSIKDDIIDPEMVRVSQTKAFWGRDHADDQSGWNWDWWLQFTGDGLNNFYSRFCNDSTHNKPMVITETSAMYNPSNSQGSTNLAIKQNWWQQVFNVQGNGAEVRHDQVLLQDSPRCESSDIISSFQCNFVQFYGWNKGAACSLSPCHHLEQSVSDSKANRLWCASCACMVKFWISVILLSQYLRLQRQQQSIECPEHL